jgi:hypothetical protein
MTAPTAPTARFIVETGADLDIFCERCRAMRLVMNLPQRLVDTGRGDIPVDALRFRCNRCHDLGTPWVSAAGNATIGRERLWPPDEPPERAP